MPLAVLDTPSATGRLLQHLGAEPGMNEGLCALMRAEVHARRQVLRAVALDRVGRMLQPILAVDRERLAAMCDALVRAGDLVLAPGGVLWATPLRVVPLASGVARLFSSLPGATLVQMLGRDVIARGACRSVAWEDALGEAVAEVGGHVLTPEAWAGLDRAPAADEAFLARLDERLAWEPEPAASSERDGPLEWRGWVPGGDRPGWRHDVAGARLWWARTAFRGHRRAWTSGEGSPTSADFVELQSGDADRARFALSRQAGASPTVVVGTVDGHAILEVPTWLPRPEYRWLSLQAEAEGDAVQTTRWRVPADAVEPITARLVQRLGLTMEIR